MFYLFIIRTDYPPAGRWIVMYYIESLKCIMLGISLDLVVMLVGSGKKECKNPTLDNDCAYAHASLCESGPLGKMVSLPLLPSFVTDW